MGSRIDDMPVFAARPEKIEAELYNLWRLARLRLGLPLRLPLPDTAEMDLVLEEHRWMVVDRNQADLPILAWIDFKDEGRSALHQPVACTLNYYHFMANRLRGSALKYMADALNARLHPPRRGRPR